MTDKAQAERSPEEGAHLFAQHIAALMMDGYVQEAISAVRACESAAESRGRERGIEEAAQLFDEDAEEAQRHADRALEDDLRVLAKTHAGTARTSRADAARIRALLANATPQRPEEKWCAKCGRLREEHCDFAVARWTREEIDRADKRLAELLGAAPPTPPAETPEET